MQKFTAKLTPANYTPFCRDLYIANYAGDVEQVNHPELFTGAIFRRMSLVMSADEQIEAFGHQIAESPATVVIIDDNISLINSECITKFDLLYVCSVLWDKYGIWENAEYIMTNESLSLWLLLLQHAIRTSYDNSTLLTNTEKKRFDKLKFTAASQPRIPAAAAQAYPTASPATAAPSLQITYDTALDSEAVHLVIDLMISNNVDVHQLCTLLAISPSNYHIAKDYFYYVNDAAKVYFYRLAYIHECAAVSKCPNDANFLFTHSQILAHQRLSNNLNGDPMICLLNGLITQPMRNLTLPYGIEGNRGFYDREALEQRISQYTGGIFDKFAWGKAYLTGSALVACAVVNPLEKYFPSRQRFWEEYYPSALIVVPKTHVKSVKILLDDEEAEPQITSAQTTDIDTAIECTLEEFDAEATRLFEHVKSIKSSACLERKETENKHKWIISGLPRSIDMFHVNSVSSVVSKFHHAIVRMYYNSQLIVFPSCLMAAFTGISMDLRWTSCNADLRDVVLKYHDRGYGTLLNKDDVHSLCEYAGDRLYSLTLPVHTGSNSRFHRQMNEYNNTPLGARKSFNPSLKKIGSIVPIAIDIKINNARERRIWSRCGTKSPTAIKHPAEAIPNLL